MKNNNLKRFLTTASALGMLAIGAQEAAAAAVQNIGANQITANAGPTSAWTAAGRTAGNPADWVGFDNANSVWTIDQDAKTVGIQVTNAGGNGGAAIKINAGKFLSTGSVSGGAILGDIKMQGAGAVLNLTTDTYTGVAANTFDKLGTVDFNNIASTVNITATGATFANQFDSIAGGANGTININAANNIFTGDIGANNALAAINVNQNTTFKSPTLKVTNIAIADDKTMTIDSTDGVIGAAGVAAGAIDGAVGGNKGKLVLTGTRAITWTGNVGNVSTLESLDIDTTSNNGSTTITGVTKVGGNVTVKNANAATATFTGAVTISNGGNFDASNAAGTVSLGAAAHSIDGTLTTGEGKFVTANPLTVTNSAGEDVAVTIGAGGSNGGNINTLNVTRGDLVINSAAGQATSFNNGVTMTAGNVTTGAGAVSFSAANGLIMTLKGSKLTVEAGGVTFNNVAANFAGGSGQIDLNGNALTLTAGNSNVIGADIVSSSAGNGTLNLGNGAVTGIIKGNIGTKDSAIGKIQVNTGAGANATTIGGAGSTTTVVNAAATTYTGASNLIIDAAANSINYYGTIDGVNGVLTISNGAAANTVTFNNAIGGTTPINEIKANANSASVVYNDIVKATTVNVNHNNVNAYSTFNKDVTANISFTNPNDKAVILGNVTGNLVSAGAAGNGDATFGNGAKADLSVTGTIGAVGGVNAVGKLNLNLKEGSLKANGGINTQNTAFVSDGTLNVANAGSTLGAVTTATPQTGTLNITDDHTLNGAVGSAANPLKAINVSSGKALTAGNFDIFAPVMGAGATFNAAALNGNTILDVGTKDAFLSAINRLGNVGNVTAGSLYGNVITVTGNNVTAKSFNTLATGAGTTISANATATILDGGSIGQVTGGAAGAGTLSLQGAATLGAVGSGNALAALNIGTAPIGLAKVVKANGNISATNINQNGGTLQLAGNTTMTGIYTVGADSAIDATAGHLTINGAAAQINNQLNVTASYVDGQKNVITAATAPAIAAGQVINLTFANGSPKDGAVLNLFGTSGGDPLALTAGTANSVVYLPNANSTGFVKSVTYNPADVAAAAGKPAVKGGTFVVNAKVDKTSFVGDSTDKNLGAVGSELAKLYTSGAATGDANTLLTNLGNMNVKNRNQAVKDFGTHDADAVAGPGIAAGAASSAAQAASSAVANVASARITTTAMGDGVAAGSASEKFGVWAQVLGGVATQKERKGAAGFSSNVVGGTIGADTMVSDNVTVGMLVADISNKAKLKNTTTTGGKLNSNTWMFGIYGNYDVGSTNFFVQGNLNIGQTAVTSKSNRVVSQNADGSKNVQTANGKYDILGVGAEVVGGYKFAFDNSYVAPTVGLRYNYFGDTSYTETGLTTANQSVKTKATSMVSGLVGARIGSEIDMDGTMLKPEVHGNFSYAFNAPTSKTSFKINGANNTFTYTGPKASRFGANFGAGVMAESEGFEYGVGYDANIADKYLAHQGSVKVKVKF